jgi:hypothetical protein
MEKGNVLPKNLESHGRAVKVAYFHLEARDDRALYRLRP